MFATEDSTYEVHFTLVDSDGEEFSCMKTCEDGGVAQRFVQYVMDSEAGELDVKQNTLFMAKVIVDLRAQGEEAVERLTVDATSIRLGRIEQVMVTRRPCEMEEGWLKIKGMTSTLFGNDSVDEEKLPVPLKKIRFTRFKPVTTGWGGSPGCGVIVAVRPVGDEKTYLGVFLCDLALDMHAEYDERTGTLDVRDSPNGNPMILIPELKKIIFGRESWWGPIKDENHLRKITDDSINDLWYVKLLKQMAEGKAEEEDETSS